MRWHHFGWTWLIAALFSAGAMSQRQAQLPWWDRAVERTIGPYWIKSDLGSEDVNAIGRHLNVMRGEYDKALAGVPVRVQEKLRVLVFANRDEAVLALRTRYAVAGANEGGFFVSPADQVLVIWVEDHSPSEIERLIQREAFRQFAFNRFGEDLPPWLEEGMTELFGEAILVGESLVFGQSTPRMCEQIKEAIAGDKHIPTPKLLTLSPEEWKTAIELEPVLLYRQVRTVALFAMQNPAFGKYLQYMNNGVLSEHALSRAFEMDVAVFDQQWNQFVQNMQAGSLLTALERTKFLAEAMLELNRRDLQPTSVDTMKTMLRQFGFAFTINSHREEIEMTSADDEPFQIPKDDLCAKQPVFTLGKARQASGQNAPPPPIMTQSLQPTGVQVKWTWNKDAKAFTYQIMTR